MDKPLQAIEARGEKVSVVLMSEPDHCPCCHRAVHPTLIYAASRQSVGEVQITYRCTDSKCELMFFALFNRTAAIVANGPRYCFDRSYPQSSTKSVFPEAVVAMSPSFVEIYDQAMSAESHELSQLVGIGLRKSLEFLIKDFASAQNPGEEAAIRNTMLMPCINKYVDDANVKECAKRATWLGNDETHYTRRWTDRDVVDLKRLVRLTVNWIDNVLMTSMYIAEMADGKPQG
ncbi:hypothetical protein LXA47_21135 [Massilia sp. P8910]|uniref:hypothetical protein n=1 Tax=Massilia antarctica TaxID=2765360 RepID=UPI001E33B649|nr:hypothetical protein [Massilia antarctica]MCE3606091.1 hypothetical protein [Massilia antarctica]